MYYVIHSMGMPFNGETFPGQSLGGSESAAYYTAKELAKRGHKVKVFTTHRDECTTDGVDYLWCGPAHERAPLGERFQHYAEFTPHDVLIIQRHHLAFHRDYASKVNIWQLHDLALFRYKGSAINGTSRLHAITTVSEFHKNQVHDVYGINPRTLAVVPNGVDPQLYIEARDRIKNHKEGQAALDVAATPGLKMLYQSRPERGLEHLLRPKGIMDRLQKEGVPAHLFVCGYDYTTQQMAPYYDQLAAWGQNLPNVTNLGPLTKSELAEVQLSCDLLCYPSEFEEVSCITAMEAMHAHLPILASRVGALPETCKGSGSVLLELRGGFANEDAFVDQIRSFIGELDGDDEAPFIRKLAERQEIAKINKTWTVAVDELEKLVYSIMGSATAQQRLRHFIDHGDIIAAEREVPNIKSDDIIGQAAIRELSSMYEFSRDPESYRKHYEHWEAVSVDNVGGAGAILATLEQRLSGTPRFQGIKHFLASATSLDRSSRVLEMGCSYGHIIIPLARAFPHLEFVGIDLVQESVNIGNSYIEKSGLGNVKLYCGDFESISGHGKFDVIIAAEVLEHVRDFQRSFDTLAGGLKPGGSIIATTPYGRWEWQGFDSYRFGREHLHHIERTDIDELFRGMEVEALCAPAGHDSGHRPIGSWVYRVKPEGKLCHAIDYERKAREVMPRQTVSLCMIAKDAENTLRKAIGSVINYVDEVIIGVDKTTRDQTTKVIARLQEENPHKPFTVLNLYPVLETGFDAARNRTIEIASGDWIMWMDSDEEAPSADNIHRLLQPSQFNAFGTAQIHYAVQPPQVLTTDYPCRLFRNRRGVKFYGLVHEHPEDTPGKAISYSTLVGDVQFVHYGYVNEQKRRERFHRNLPLLLKDVERYPDRILNKFLMLRDIAQSIGFEREQGQSHPEQFSRAERGCSLFKELLSSNAPTRMVVDSLQYYSICVATLNVGFDAELSLESGRPDLPEVAYSVRAKARFHNREDYLAIVSKLAQESSTNYDSRYI